MKKVFPKIWRHFRFFEGNFVSLRDPTDLFEEFERVQKRNPKCSLKFQLDKIYYLHTRDKQFLLNFKITEKTSFTSENNLLRKFFFLFGEFIIEIELGENLVEVAENVLPEIHDCLTLDLDDEIEIFGISPSIGFAK